MGALTTEILTYVIKYVVFVGLAVAGIFTGNAIKKKKSENNDK